MVAPQSVILELSHYRPLFISELKNTPPNRVCYKIKHKYPKSTSKRAVEFFENALEDFLAESSLPDRPGMGTTEIKNGKHKSVRKIFCFTVSSYYIIYTRIFDPPLSTKKRWVFLSDHLFSALPLLFDPCTCFLKILLSQNCHKEPRPINGMALIITLHFQAFSFHSVNV